MNLRKDIRDLISVNEKIQSAIMQGDPITDDEASVIRLCATVNYWKRYRRLQ